MTVRMYQIPAMAAVLFALGVSLPASAQDDKPFAGIFAEGGATYSQIDFESEGRDSNGNVTFSSSFSDDTLDSVFGLGYRLQLDNGITVAGQYRLGGVLNEDLLFVGEVGYTADDVNHLFVGVGYGFEQEELLYTAGYERVIGDGISLFGRAEFTQTEGVNTFGDIVVGRFSQDRYGASFGVRVTF